METLYQDNQIIFISSLIPAYAVIGSGFLSVFLGLIFYKRIYKRLRLFWLVFGFLLMSLGVMDLKVGEYKKIIIDGDKKELTILERKYFGEIVQTIMPFDNFSHVEVLRDWSIRQGKLLSTSDLEVTINIVRWGFKPIELGIYDDKTYLRELINKLRTTVSFPVYLIGNAQDKNFGNFIRQFINADNTEILYRYTDVLDLLITKMDSVEITPPQYALPHPINVKIVQEGSDTMAIWNNMHNVFWILLVGIGAFAGMYLQHNWLLHKHGFSIGFAVTYATFVIALVVWIGFLFSSIFSKTRIDFTESNIVYSTRLFGITAFKQSTAKLDVYLDAPIINTINPKENQLTVITAAGYSLLLQSMSETIEVVNQEFKRAQNFPMDYRILIDVSGLSMGERLFLEEEMRKHMMPMP